MDITRKNRIAGAIVGLALASLSAGLHFSGLTAHIELPFRDHWMKIRGPLQAPPEIAIVGVDDRSIGPARPWPWPDGVLVELLESIARDEPAVIVLTAEWPNLFARRNRPSRELERLQSIRSLALPAIVARAPDAFGSLRIEMPGGALSPLVGAVSRARELGGIVRDIETSYFLEGTVFPALDVVAARRFAESAGGAGLAGPSATRIPIRFLGPPGTIPYIPAEGWLRGEAPAGALRGKIAILGVYLTAFRGLAATPGAPPGALMAEAELLANGIATLLAGSTPREVPPVVVLLAFLVLGAVLLPVFGMVGIARAVALLVLVEIASLFGFHELAMRDVFAPVLTTGLLVLVCFLAALPIRSLRVAESIRAHVLHAPLVPHEGASIALVEGGQRLWGEVALESRRLLDFDALCFIVRSQRGGGLGLVRSEGMEPTRIRSGAWRVGRPPFRDTVGADGPVECPPLFDDPEVTSYLCPLAYQGVVLGFLALGTRRGPAHMEGRAAIVKQISLAIASELRRREGRKHLEGRGILALSGQSEKTVLGQVAGLEETLRVAQNEREIIDAALRHADGGVFVSDVFGRVTRMSPGIESILSPIRQSLGWGIDDLPEIIALLTGQVRERAVASVNQLLGSAGSLVLEATLPPERSVRLELRLEAVLRKTYEGEGSRPGQVLAIVASIRRPAEDMAALALLGEIRELVAGELQGHVGAIQGFAEILARSGGLTGATREYLAALQANVNDLHAAVKRATDKLAPARAESGKSAAAAEICQEVIETLAPEARRKGVALLLEAPLQESLHVLTDGDRMREGLRGLLADLIERSSASDTLELSAGREGERVRLQVLWASGKGGSEEVLGDVARAARASFGLGEEGLEASPDPRLGGRFHIWLPAAP